MPFKPGESGNPAGRPKKGEALTEILRNVVDKELLAQKLMEKVEDGDLNAIKYVYDRVDGKPKETVEQTNIEMPAVVGFYPDDYEQTAEEDSEANKES